MQANLVQPHLPGLAASRGTLAIRMGGEARHKLPTVQAALARTHQEQGGLAGGLFYHLAWEETGGPTAERPRPADPVGCSLMAGADPAITMELRPTAVVAAGEGGGVVAGEARAKSHMVVAEGGAALIATVLRRAIQARPLQAALLVGAGAQLPRILQ